jgi:putative transcriptional regulator
MVSIESTRAEILLSGQLLVAMPHMADPRFARTVVYICAHSDDGAMGLVVNRLIDSMRFESLLDHLDLKTNMPPPDLPVHFGGPVEASRGFVLHSTDVVQESTLMIDDDVALTATTEMLRAIAYGSGPQHCVLALGYAGWGAGQLDQEIQDNGWLLVPPDDQLVFGLDDDAKWEGAIAKLGIDLSLLSSEAGHA